MTISELKLASILDLLDSRARASDFPIVQNTSFAPFAARLIGRGDARDWLITIAWFGFHEQELAFPVNVFCYGSVIPDGYALRQSAGLQLDPETWSASSAWEPLMPIQASAFRRSFLIGDGSSAADVVLPRHDFTSEVAFGHALTRELGYSAFLPSGLEEQVCPEGRSLPIRSRMDDWDHPLKPARDGVAASADLRWSCEQLVQQRDSNPPVGRGLRAMMLARLEI